MDIKKSLKDVIVLFVICVVFTGILAATNSVTAPIIADRLNAAANEAYLVVMPDAKGFEDVDLSTYALPTTIKEVKKETSGQGYVIKIETKGYADGLIIVAGISADGKVINSTVVSNNETPSKIGTLLNDGEYNANFNGKGLDEVSGVDTVAGVTYTTKGYKNALIDAINAVTILGGGSVDLRTEEEILRDNLKAALPSGGEAFTEMFMVEIVTGVNKIYSADNGAGYVCVIGEGDEAEFIGVEGGVALGDSANKAVAEAAVAIVSSTTYENIDITEYVNSEDRTTKRIFKSIVSLKKTATGNYVFEIKASGYGSEQMVLRISISADGKMIDYYTVSHSETPTFGGGKLESDFYDQYFVGKNETESNAVDFDVIKNGSTVTSNAFKKAVTNCFTAINILEGGATNE